MKTSDENNSQNQNRDHSATGYSTTTSSTNHSAANGANMKKKDPTLHRIIEKRRRDRMNSCLADLSKLIPAHYMKKGRGRVEKTEIIEMAIRHLKDLIELANSQQQHQPAAATTTTTANDHHHCRQPPPAHQHLAPGGDLPPAGVDKQHQQRPMPAKDERVQPRTGPDAGDGPAGCACCCSCDAAAARPLFASTPTTSDCGNNGGRSSTSSTSSSSAGSSIATNLNSSSSGSDSSSNESSNSETNSNEIRAQFAERHHRPSARLNSARSLNGSSSSSSTCSSSSSSSSSWYKKALLVRSSSGGGGGYEGQR